MALGLVLTYAMAVGNLLQFVLEALGPILTVDLELTRAQLGGLSSVYFGAGSCCPVEWVSWSTVAEAGRCCWFCS